LAKKDSLSANLQRLQIIKGWLDTDGVHEKVYDIACSDGLTPDSSHVCPSNNAKVNIAYAKMISSKYEYLKVKYYIDYLYEKGK